MRYAIYLVLLAWSATVHADVFKCQTPAGDAVFSDTPCDQGEMFKKVRPSESVSDPNAARLELERQRAYTDKVTAENAAARQAAAGIATLPDYSSPPPASPEPRPLSPPTTMGAPAKH
jgi:hypothetical protein